MEPYDLLEDLVKTIEQEIHNKLTIEYLANKYFISPVHLQRIFKFAFGITLASYIRSRKMAVALKEIMSTDANINQISYDLDFGHEPSFIRSFKREYGYTPNQVRKLNKELSVTAPLSLTHYTKMEEGILSQLEFVIIPPITIIGKETIIYRFESITKAPEAALNFYYKEMPKIKHIKNKYVYIGYTYQDENREAFNYYIPSIEVSEDASIPDGYKKIRIPSCECVKFKYIGNHHYTKINANLAHTMYQAIDDFQKELGNKYIIPKDFYFERIDAKAYDGEFCQLEWFTPIKKITS